MKTPFLVIPVLAASLVASTLSAGDRFTTLSNTPIGTREAPLILRTFLPDPGLSREVISNYGLGSRARKYSPGKGDVEGFVDPVQGIPAAIAVSFGPDLSLCWDTTECRLLYAWQGGFLDMTNYWGLPESGRRAGFNYLPSIVGELIYLARGSAPLVIFDHYTDDTKPRYIGYRLIAGVPEFSYRVGSATVRVRIEPGDEPLTIEQHYLIESSGAWGYTETGYSFKNYEIGDGSFRVRIQGEPVTANGHTAEKPAYSTETPNAEWGEALYTMLGCFACHSTDGTRGHGPTFSGVYGTLRPITGGEPVLADEAYIAESIINPLAKVVDPFPAGYMPPYPIGTKQIEALTLFIKRHANE